MLQALRADPDLLAIAVVLLTSLHMRIGMTSGADDYATKPFFGRVSCAKPLPRSATGARCAYDDFSGAAGVFVTELRLQSLADFLRTQVISSRGAAYLVDEAGLLVASSPGDALYQSLPGGLEHVKPAESNNPVKRASYAALQAGLRQSARRWFCGPFGFITVPGDGRWRRTDHSAPAALQCAGTALDAAG